MLGPACAGLRRDARAVGHGFAVTSRGLRRLGFAGGRAPALRVRVDGGGSAPTQDRALGRSFSDDGRRVHRLRLRHAALSENSCAAPPPSPDRLGAGELNGRAHFPKRVLRAHVGLHSGPRNAKAPPLRLTQQVCEGEESRHKRGASPPKSAYALVSVALIVSLISCFERTLPNQFAPT